VPAARRGREIHLVARPIGEPTHDDFGEVEVDVPAPGDREVLVRNTFMSVDPYMRGRMNDVKSYAPPFELDRVMTGGAVGEVVASNSPSLDVGDAVLHNLGWREYAVGPDRYFQKVDPSASSLSRYLGILGMTGLTAYTGLVDVAQFHAPDTVFVSGAAGAVGSAVGQMARLLGAARVIGSAGTDEKVALLTGQLGFDAAFNYHSGRISKLLAAATPDGIDVYFDNVGGEHLEAAIGALRPFGRVAACGAISVYNATEPAPGPRNLGLVVGKRLTIRGFIVGDQADRREEFVDRVGVGKVVVRV
jgi:NADPH-dependent curcumin reductase CurA